MSDLRGFTPLTEGLAPEQVLRLLNRYLRRDGRRDPRPPGHDRRVRGRRDPRDLRRARSRARTTRGARWRARSRCRARWPSSTARNEAEGLPRLEMGIAVHTGEVIVGNIGSERRTKYGVVGSAVNHAGPHRVVHRGRAGADLRRDAARRRATGVRGRRARSSIDAKGTREPIVVHDLRGFGERARARRRGRAAGARRSRSPCCATSWSASASRPRPSARGSSSCRPARRHAAHAAPPARALEPQAGDAAGRTAAPVELYAKVVHVVGRRLRRACASRPLPADVEAWLRERRSRRRGRGLAEAVSPAPPRRAAAGP